MKRSEINRILQNTIAFSEKMNFKLPPFAFWSPQDWHSKGHEYDEIRDNRLGWDITDFGLGNFDKIGLTLFTLRNGNLKNKKYPKTYGEKLLIIQEDQVTPYHFHWRKMEDIINRGGGNLLCRVCNSTKDEKLSTAPVAVISDGRRYTVPAGQIVTLRPGESITLPQKMYHEFWAQKGKGTVLTVEVSKVNDDTNDNRFLDPVGRFPKIEEDEQPVYLLCNEYPPAQ